MKQFVIRNKTLLRVNDDYLQSSSFDIDNSVHTIGNSAFQNNEFIQSIHLDQTITKIKNGAFYQCKNLKSINLENIIELDNGCFCYCTSLDNLIFNNKLESIPNNCFQECSRLSTLDLSNTNVKKIGISSFNNCTNLKQIQFNNLINHISADAFNNTGIVDLVLPANLKIIEPFAFANNHDLTTITIECSFKALLPRVFDKCFNIQKVIIKNNQEIDKTIFNNWEKIEFIIK